MIKLKNPAKPTGYILYEGPSMLDGVTPIVVIATGIKGASSKNIKTGSMIQTWVLLRDVNPVEALLQGLDSSVCGNCPLRRNGCYVLTHQAPLQVWKKYKRGGYPVMAPDDFGVLVSRTRQMIRLGSYGDPTAAPLDMWNTMLDFAGTAHTGYTHQWHQNQFQGFNKIVMASCETPIQAAFAAAKGFRAFLVTATEEVPQGFVRCPASKEHEAATGRKLTCEQCKICNGNDGKFKRQVAITAHGGAIQGRMAKKVIMELALR